jgi:hypothetical protein
MLLPGACSFWAGRNQRDSIVFSSCKLDLLL